MEHVLSPSADNIRHPEQAAAGHSLFGDAYDLGIKTARVGKVLVEGTLVGAYRYAKDEVQHDLPGLLLETGVTAGIGAATVAGLMTKPSIAAPALSAVALVGGIIICKQVGQRLWASRSSLSAAWDSGNNSEAAMKVIGDQLGPYAFDYTLGTLAGIAGGVATHLAMTELMGECSASAGSWGRYILRRNSCRFSGLAVAEASEAGSNSSYLPDIEAEAQSAYNSARTFLKTGGLRTVPGRNYLEPLPGQGTTSGDTADSAHPSPVNLA